MKIENFENYNEGLEMAMWFFNSLEQVNESVNPSKYRRVQRNEIKRLNRVNISNGF